MDCNHEKLNRWGSCQRCHRWIGSHKSWHGRCHWLLVSLMLGYFTILGIVAYVINR